MENIGEWEQKNLKNELIKGKELAKKLQSYLNDSSFSDEDCEFLVEKILSSYQKALSMLNNGGLIPIKVSESLMSVNGSPMSEDSDREFKDQDQKNTSRKREIFPSWTQKVRVGAGMTLEGALEDGFCWRKYGQKGILGAKHPRGYYRCTHRNLQGCLATKQVQRSDEDPTIFLITYRRHHTCNSPELSPANPPFDPTVQIHRNHPPFSPEPRRSSWSSLRVETENLDSQNHAEFSPSVTSLFGLNNAGFSGNLQSFPENKHELSGIFPGNKQEGSGILAPESSGLAVSSGLEFLLPFGEVEMDPSFMFDSMNFFS